MIRKCGSIDYRFSRCEEASSECFVVLGGSSMIGWMLWVWEDIPKNILPDGPRDWWIVRSVKSITSNLDDSVNDFTKHSMVRLSVKSLSELPMCSSCVLFLTKNFDKK